MEKSEKYFFYFKIIAVGIAAILLFWYSGKLLNEGSSPLRINKSGNDDDSSGSADGYKVIPSITPAVASAARPAPESNFTIDMISKRDMVDAVANQGWLPFGY